MQENNVEITGDLLKRIQTINLEMLMEIDRICRKNNIKYSIMYGTLLGAVRHGGFIPWDDDCDVVFRRYEYEKFFEACKKDLDTDKFFLQDHRTDSGYLFGYGKLRRNGTVFKRTGQEHIRQHGGLFIDLLILDEPASGMDPRARYEMKGILKNLTKGTTTMIEPLPDVMIRLLNDGGLIEHIKKIHVNSQHEH